MNQQDESVVMPTIPMPNSTSPSGMNQANETPTAVTPAPEQVPTAPMTFATSLPDLQAPAPADNPIVITQPLTQPPTPNQPTAPTSISVTPDSLDLPAAEATPEPIVTIPLPVQDNPKGMGVVETKPSEMPQASSLPTVPSMSAPLSSSIPDISLTPAPPMPITSDLTSANEHSSTEPLQSVTLPSVPNQPTTPLGTTNPTPSLDEAPIQPTSHEQHVDPIVIEAQPLLNPEPLPTPLTPPTIKTSPSPVLSSPGSPAVAPVTVTMSSPLIEPQNKPLGQAAPVLVKGAGKYQIRVINEKCIGAASCVAVAPKAFKLNEQQIAEVLASASEESDENLLLSAQSCPTMAIEIVDSETGKKVWPR